MIKEHVEELIEESYLLCLSDKEIRDYFREFLDVCDFTLRSNLSIHDSSRITNVKIALLKARLFISENPVHVTKHDHDEETERSCHEILAKQIVIAKRSIIRILAGINPSLVNETLDAFTLKTTQKNRNTVRHITFNDVIIASGYYLLLLGAIILILFVGFH